MEKRYSKFGGKLGENIKNKRIEKMYSQKEIALVLDYSEAHISRIEKGKQIPSLEFLYKICCLLKCDTFELLPTFINVEPNDFNCA
tara:strand:- start:373 stop:630 length:258 start_codon:yes stop_codon:yes gene_type:complete